MHCPNPECAKKFDQLAMLVDNSTVPRETYYACPYCSSRIDIVFHKESLKFSKRAKEAKKEKSADCPYYFGYLKLFCKGGHIPEECLTCKRLTACTDKESNHSGLASGL